MARKAYRKKRRSCSLCKPFKKGLTACWRDKDLSGSACLRESEEPRRLESAVRRERILITQEAIFTALKWWSILKFDGLDVMFVFGGEIFDELMATISAARTRRARPGGT